MLQALLFLHLLAAAMLFAGLGIETAAFIQLHRATTVEQARGAMLPMPMVGPIMGPSAGILILAGLGLAFMTGFGWQPWTVTGLLVAVALAINGPLTNGRRMERIFELVAEAPNGPITARLETARCDRFLTYSVASMLTLLIAMLYVMSNKPPLAGCIIAVLLALAVPLIPALRVRASIPLPRAASEA